MISTNKEIDETIINCFKSKSDIASMLPKIIFFISTEVGFRDIMNNPNAKKDVKIIENNPRTIQNDMKTV